MTDNLQSKWWRDLEFLPGFVDGVVECQARAVQHETVGGVAVEAVPEDGVTEAVRMGGMDTQLMGTSRVGGEEDPCRVPATFEDFPVGDTEFAMDGVEDLPRPVGGVDAEGELDVSRVRFDPALNKKRTLHLYVKD